MATKSGRYQLRSSGTSSQREDDYETPKMDAFGNMDNAQLSQSDVFQYNSQMENFLSDSFGGKFNSMQSFGENDFGLDLNGIAKEEADPALSRFNYMGSQEQKYLQDEQFVPLGEHALWPQQEPQYLEDGVRLEEEVPGGFICSQGLNEEYKFAVAVMPQAKTSNKDYLFQEDLLFVRFMAGIPFTFMLVDVNDKTKPSIPMPANMNIRMSLRFRTPVSDDKQRVGRCQVHIDRDQNGTHRRFPFTVNHRTCSYDDDNLFVTIPASSVVSLTFFCYSSCAGGVDRRPVYVLFELMDLQGDVVQTVELNVKVCANPSRDGPKEEERKKKEEEKFGKGKVKSEGGSETIGKRGRKRKTGEGDEKGRDSKRMDSASPMQSVPTPSPGWNTTMPAPRVTTSRRNSKREIRSTSSDAVTMESNSLSHKNSDDEEDRIFNVSIRGRKNYDRVMEFVKLISIEERHVSSKEEDNPFENLTQLTGDETISTWLGQFNLNEENYVNAFRSMGITTLNDLEKLYTPSLFRISIGIPQQSAAKLNKVYINWLNCSKAVI